MNPDVVRSINSAAEVWFNWMRPMAWQVAVLVFIVALMSWLMRRQSARFRFALWLLVPLRLVLPPTLALATGWGWWLLPTREPENTSAIQAIGDAQNSTPSSGSLSADNITSLPYESYQSFQTYLPPSDRIIPPDQVLRASNVDLPESVVGQPTYDKIHFSRASWLFTAWLVGVAALTLRLLYGYISALKIARRARPYKQSGVQMKDDHHAQIVQCLAECRSLLGIKRRVQIAHLSDAAVPMVIGILRPTIILPTNLCDHISRPELQAVLVHELQHVLRHDGILQFVQAVLGAVYFFHPLVWVANWKLNAFREEACDESTVAVLKGQRRDYVSAIIKIAESMSGPTPSMSIGIVTSRRVKRRLQRILHPQFRIGRGMSWSAIGVLVAVAFVALPVGARSIDSKSQASTQIPPDESSSNTYSERDRQFAIKSFALQNIEQNGHLSLAADNPWKDRLVFWRDGALGRIGGAPLFLDEEFTPAPVLIKAIEKDWLVLSKEWISRADVPSDMVGQLKLRVQDAMRVDEASDYYESQIKQKPTAAAFANLSAVRRTQGRFEQAIDIASKAIAIDRGCLRAYHNRALARLCNGDDRGAISDFSQALVLKPASPVLWVERGRARAICGDVKGALSDCAEAIRRDPSLAVAYEVRAYASCRSNDYERTVAACTDALRHDPKNASLFSYRGDARLRKGDLDGSIADFTSAIALGPFESGFYEWRGAALYQKGTFNDAIRDFTAALAIDPRSSWSWTTRGNAHVSIGDYDTAVQDYTRAIELDSSDFRVYYNRAFALYRRTQFDGTSSLYKRYDEAIRDYTKVIQLNPKFAEAYCGRGYAFWASRNRERADQDFATAALLDSKYVPPVLLTKPTQQPATRFDTTVLELLGDAQSY